jgi:hypothetical protein
MISLWNFYAPGAALRLIRGKNEIDLIFMCEYKTALDLF